jgi:hypothetical protein
MKRLVVFYTRIGSFRVQCGGHSDDHGSCERPEGSAIDADGGSLKTLVTVTGVLHFAIICLSGYGTMVFRGVWIPITMLIKGFNPWPPTLHIPAFPVYT